MSLPFRFATLLTFRERQRDESAAAVAEAQGQLHQIDSALAALRQSRDSARDSLLATRTGIISAQSLKSHQDYLASLQREEHALNARRARLLERVETLRDDLIGKHRDVTQLEKLLQRHRSREQVDLQRAEQREHDAMAAAPITAHRPQQA